jgi:hypothetical protein
MVSSALGRDIRAGHRVKLTGPFGRAFFREGHSGRIVLVASGTGFAPMWSVAVAAIMEQPQREMVFIVAARSIRSLYMHAALYGWRCFPMSPDSDGFRTGADLTPFAAEDRPITCQDCRRTTWSIPRAGDDRRRGVIAKPRAPNATPIPSCTSRGHQNKRA